MSDNKLWLTRNRLFEPSNVVLFKGRYKQDFSKSEVNKAFKLLCAKYPIIDCFIDFSDGENAYLESKTSKTEVVFSELDFAELEKTLPVSLEFSEELFKFYVSKDNYLVIVSHTVVSDGKSLLRLAKSFVDFYERKNLSVEEEQLCLFSDFKSLPVEVGSPLTDKLAANLDEKYNKNPARYDLNDYKKLVSEYKKRGVRTQRLKKPIGKSELSGLKKYCEENECDVSSVIAFCLYKNLSDIIKLKKKENKFISVADRRFFFNNAHKCSLGAFDGTVEISLDKKAEKGNDNDKVKGFQKNYYKSMTSVFKTHYEDVLLSKLIPSSCDAMYMYALGFNNNKASKNLAENYGCLNKKLCKYSSYNLEQKFWNSLNSFADIECREAFRMQYETVASLVLTEGESAVYLRFDSEKYSCEIMENVLSETINMMKSLCC